MALYDRHFNDTHNNQMQDGFHVTVDVGEDAFPGQSVWGAPPPKKGKHGIYKYVDRKKGPNFFKLTTW